MKTSNKLSLIIAVLAISALTAVAGTSRGTKPGQYYVRSDWGARAPQCSLSYNASLNRCVFHHTASTGDYTTTGKSATFANVRGHQNYHMDVNGWCDIGYHYLVDKLGNVCTGRLDSGTLAVNVRGAHDGINDNSFGFTFMGYYHPPYSNPTTASLRQQMWQVVAWRMPNGWSSFGSGSYGGHTVGKVCSHRDVDATACPGDGLYGPYIGNNWNGGTARVEIDERRP
jgi:hypothetical protein